MDIGLLWYDDNPSKTLAEKVVAARHRYIKKYGVHPNVCYVHPTEFPENNVSGKVAGILTIPLRSVLLHHIWIGCDETACDGN